MDKKRIIDEGLLESYLLGNMSGEDQADLENVLRGDPDLRAQLSALEVELEEIGFENAIDPPVVIKERLKNSLKTQADISGKAAKYNADNGNTLKSGKLLVAASLAALFALSSFWLYRQWQSSISDIRTLEEQTVDLRNRLQILEKQYETTTVQYTTISDPAVIPLYLVGNQISPQSRAIAYVNHQDKTVILNGRGLEPLESDQTYQMWADVEGEMINMGLVPAEGEYIPLRYIDKAESLNITIEPAGGSEHPTVEKLISNIYL